MMNVEAEIENALVAAHSVPAEESFSALKVDPELGLSTTQVTQRTNRLGRNELPEPTTTSLPKRALRQLKDAMALLLIVAAAISGIALGELAEALAITAIVILNAVIALVQEGKAERALSALRNYESSHARVLRDGTIALTDASELVPGDILFVNEGDRVPADVRLISSEMLRIDESSLTGESLPVTKRADQTLPQEIPVADRTNMLFSGTLTAHGSGRGVVIATGTRTQLGSLAAHLSAARRPTPLQQELGRLTTRLGTLAMGAAAIAFFVTLSRQGLSADSLRETFLTAVALAVAAVPEGLATVVTVALAIGVVRMASHGAIVRRLPAVETLGATTFILTDKTGTLTRNELSVVDEWFPDGDEKARTICAVCNDATIDPPTGDPLEIALLRWIGAADADARRARTFIVAKAPFDSTTKLMSVTVQREGSYEMLVKGAPEAVLELSSKVPHLSAAEVNRRAAELAARGTKVLGLAAGSVATPETTIAGADLRFVGLIALGDPLRPEAFTSVKEARDAGVHVVMVTGDHVETARAIAEEAGLDNSSAITGREIAERGIPGDPREISIYARTTPDQKLELVRRLEELGEIVAVTGDGVNDAPALHRADIGVAMGRVGTDVAKEASDLVITDDNLATIVTAIREGRGIYDNVRKVVEYLVAANISEVAVVIASLLFFPELGVPLLPLQLLWINLITDGPPALALGIDPVPDYLMTRPPRSPRDSLLGTHRMKRLIGRGLTLAAGCLATLVVARFVWDEPWSHARANMFVALALAQLVYAFTVRSAHARIFSNRWLLVGTGAGLLLLIAAVHWGPLQELLGTASLSAREWLLVIGAALLPSLLISISESRRG